MKRVIKTVALLWICLLWISTTWAEYKNSSNKVDSWYKTVTFSNDFEFSAERDGALIQLKWNKYKGDDFQYYKIMRSETHENPVYPDQPALRYLWDVENDNFSLKNWSKKSAIFRICVITTEKNRICSNVVKLWGYEHNKEDFKKSDEYKKELEEKKKQYQEKSTSKKVRLQKNLEQKVDKIVNNLVKKIKNKYPENIVKQEKILENLIVRLEKHPAKKEQTKLLISYLIKKINEAKEWLSSAEKEMDEVFKMLEQ